MPATEQTWRDTKRMHVIFGISALAMLATTVWMLGADHNREWKGYQRKFRSVETWVSDSRINQQNDPEFQAETARLAAALEKVRLAPLPADKINEFKQLAESRSGSSEGDPQGTASPSDIRKVTDAQKSLVEAQRVLASAEETWAANEKVEGLTEEQLDELREDVAAAKRDVLASRTALLDAMAALIKKARFAEDNLQVTLKATRAKLDEVNSIYSIAVDEGADAATLEKHQAAIDAVKQEVQTLRLSSEKAKVHRLALEALLTQITAPEAEAQKALADHEAQLTRLETARAAVAPNFGKRLLEMPIIDAFGRPLKVEQIWLPNLTLNNNFKDVARFDRCTTCHLGIDRTAAGSAVEPAYEQVEPLELLLATPKQAPEPKPDAAGNPQSITTRDVYGLKLADFGLVDANDVTVSVVWPRTPAALAGLEAGDVLQEINDVKMTSVELGHRYLLESVTWGQPLRLKVRRGVPQPFASHPRLDLFVGSLSPHKMGDFGCTICHEGQGSATQFKWASHTPNDPEESYQWKRKHGWFNNHHWIIPMLPDRFSESSCLKCHHDVVELEPSERFPEPPAPKLMAGYEVIRNYGCFGCHEINGYDGPSRRRGPDVRNEPPYFAAAAQLLTDSGLSADSRRLAQQVIDHPEVRENRKLLAESILNAPAAKSASAASKRLAAMVGADDETPGQFRKVGPSLRHVDSKLTFDFLYRWVKDPRDFRPSTKMPQFFGQWGHLEQVDPHNKDQTVLYGHAHGDAVSSPGLAEAERFEPIEIRAASEYLLARSQPFTYIEPPKDVTEAPSIERGKQMFQMRGCLACHQHADFPSAKSTQGPNLDNLGSKLPGEKGKRWLYSWVREPNRYHARTVMPNLFLDKINLPGGKSSDPAADITAYLLSFRGWKPSEIPEFDDESRQALDELARKFLQANFTGDETRRILRQGIAAERAGELKGDEVEMVAHKPELSAEELEQMKLLYVGRRTISRLGCAGCHDIPGFEDAKPIGTGLADWGRKETSKLAFEQIIPYLQRQLGHGGANAHDVDDSEFGPPSHVADGHHLNPRELGADDGFYVDALLNHQREGFIWQKLREPRSYDYKKTENKDYTERLRMPKFNLSDEQREAVITFVLGLVAEPPAAKYVYQPSPHRKAVIEGERLVEKFNCSGCHELQLEEWAFSFKPYDAESDTGFRPPLPVKDFPFLSPHFSPEQLEASKKTDSRGLGRARVAGVPNPEPQEDDDGNPFHYFGLWQSAAIDGRVWLPTQQVPISDTADVEKRAPRGGELARLLHPAVVENERKTNPNVKASDVWGWLPPPLKGEGQKVQTQWLHDFLLDPYMIRPSTVLRMPKFNMSSDEATALANYFAARDGATFPYEFDSRTRTETVTSPAAQERMAGALRVVTDNNFCVKCHRIGDFVPEGAPSAHAPQLDQVSSRLRPDFLLKWIANPPRQLPYTGMPVNFPIDKPADQKLLPGTSEEQVNAVVDLLLNWPTFMKGKTSIKSMVKPAPAAPPAAGGGN